MIRAYAQLSGNRRLLLLGLTDVNLSRLARGGDEGFGQPIKRDLSECVPVEAWADPIGSVDLVIFYASRESILALAEAVGVDPKGMLDQLGEG